MIPGSTLDVNKLTKKDVDMAKEVFVKHDMIVSSLARYLNHLEPDENKR